jgi:hypothetical protein
MQVLHLFVDDTSFVVVADIINAQTEQLFVMRDSFSELILLCLLLPQTMTVKHNNSTFKKTV